MDVAQLLQQLDADREAFVRTSVKLSEAIAQIAPRGRAGGIEVRDDNPASPTSPTLSLPVPSAARRSRAPSVVSHARPALKGIDDGSISDDSDEDDDESYYVQEPLQSNSFDHEHLRQHLSEYKFDRQGRQILASLFEHHGRLKQPSLFYHHPGWIENSARYSHYQVFEVGADGAPLQANRVGGREGGEDNSDPANSAWLALKDINSNTKKERKAVGRITIAREPSSILFGALHLTLHDAFDMDELFRLLVDTEVSSAYIHGSFHEDHRRQRSFVFNFEYYTIIGQECEPMRWQLATNEREASESHLPLSRCSAVVALSLHGEPIKRIRNPARRAKMRYGHVYDPWAPWQVVNIQCYPDWRSRTDTHDSSKHYVNGVEAFLRTVLCEYRDAQRRFEEIYKRISKLIIPPVRSFLTVSKAELLFLTATSMRVQSYKCLTSVVDSGPGGNWHLRSYASLFALI